MDEKRSCLLCDKDICVDLLELGTVDDQHHVFYAPNKRLAASGVCHMGCAVGERIVIGEEQSCLASSPVEKRIQIIL